MEVIVHDLAIITVSTNEAHWIKPCLRTVFEHIGDGLTVDVVVVDNDSTDGTADLVATEFPRARTVWALDYGFGHANNRALMTCNSRYVLFLNPDTEILEGNLADLIRLMDRRPGLGAISCRQVVPDGDVDLTIRRFPNALRALGEALGADRWSRRPRWLGERELNPAAYERESDCDWTTGAFLIVRREALESSGYFDERFFLYSEETDLCRRIKTQGWDIRHVPDMTILHHAGKGGINAKLESLGAASRMAYARKHFSPLHRLAYGCAIALRFGIRAVYAGPGETGRLKRTANRQALATLLGRKPVPFTEITCAHAVVEADVALRDGSLTARPARNADGVAS